MAHTIALLNEKGGCGKTTLATNLACAYADDGARVLAVDADRQATLRRWNDERDDDREIVVVGIDGPSMDEEVRKLAGDFDVVLIDTPGTLERTHVAALRAASSVLLPVGPSSADVWAADETVHLVQQRRDVTGGQPDAAYVLWNVKVGTRLARSVRGDLSESPIRVLDPVGHNREAFRHALSSGRSVLDTPDTKAQAEVRAIASSIIPVVA